MQNMNTLKLLQNVFKKILEFISKEFIFQLLNYLQMILDLKIKNQSAYYLLENLIQDISKQFYQEKVNINYNSLRKNRLSKKWILKNKIQK